MGWAFFAIFSAGAVGASQVDSGIEIEFGDVTEAGSSEGLEGGLRVEVESTEEVVNTFFSSCFKSFFNAFLSSFFSFLER